MGKFKERLKAARSSVSKATGAASRAIIKPGKSDLVKQVAKQEEMKEKLKQAAITGRHRAMVEAKRERANISRSGATSRGQKVNKFFSKVAQQTGGQFQTKVATKVNKKVMTTKRKNRRKLKVTKRRIKRQVKKTQSRDDGMLGGGFEF